MDWIEKGSAATSVSASATLPRFFSCRKPLQIVSASLVLVTKMSFVLIDGFEEGFPLTCLQICQGSTLLLCGLI